MVNRRKAEPAEKLLTLRPVVSYNVKAHGFHGALYKPENNRFPGKILITIGGSDGMYSLTRYGSEVFVREGIPVLAVAYWNVEGTPDRMDRVPLDSLEKAAERMKGLGFKQIILWGISMGSIAALNLAVRRPDLISGVISVSGLDCTIQSICTERTGLFRKKWTEHSIFTWHGEEIPCESFTCQPGWNLYKEWIRQRQYTQLPCFENIKGIPEGNQKAANMSATAAEPQTTGESAQSAGVNVWPARIPVEKLGGPLLLLNAENDAMWPAQAASLRIMKKLDETGFPYLHEHYSYKAASHFLLPFAINTRRVFAIERKDLEGCSASRKDAHRKTMDFLRKI